MTATPLRPIHYLGNKSRHLRPIVSTVLGLAAPGTSVIDLFAGTGVVSRELAKARQVTSVDVQAYSATLAQALCSPRKYDARERTQIVERARNWLDALPSEVSALLDYESMVTDGANTEPSLFVLLTEEGSLTRTNATDPALSSAKADALAALTTAGAVITSYYGGVYFSYRQALEIDALMAAIGHSHATPAEATAVAALLGVASDTVSTVGSHFAQPTRLRARTGEPKVSSIVKTIRARSASVLVSYELWLRRYAALDPTKFACSTVTSDFRAVLGTIGDDVGAIYADPPYTRDHYSRFYHVLETIAVGDDPGVTTAPGSDQASRGLYRLSRHQSPFSIRSQVASAFNVLFESAGQRAIPLVLSYSPQGSGTRARPETRLMTIDRIAAAARARFSEVYVVPIDTSVHSRFNRTDLHGETPDDAEVLIVARP
ncbi:DNA adenine methylase [Microbacterium sp. RU33B]|uniref:DNA adenine methylase n=1 Tax=Microbacterium sp. RU33B TaxID=1907390 RepID=UPI0035569785